MNTIYVFLSSPAWQNLALALLHTLWQGAVAAILLWLLLRRVSTTRPEARYWLSFAVLAGIVSCALITWSILDYEQPQNAATVKTILLPNVIISNEQSVNDLHAPDNKARSANLQQHTTASGFDKPPVAKWIPLFVIMWLVGVAIMMFRMGWMVAGLRRFIHGPEVTDGQLFATLNELRLKLGISRPLRIVDTATSFGPMVLGIVRPILAMPISMITGLPADTLRAILAHELAHILRHDFLLNIAQMLIEAVLFFNPAVWWISRQIRIEREACCDSLAAHILGQPLAYAQALGLWAELVRATYGPLVAPAWRSNPGPRLLLDRIQRLLLPGYRPVLPVSFWGLLGLLFMGILILGGMWRGTSMAVELAAKILTPAERIEHIIKTQEEYGSKEKPTSEDPNGRVTLTGNIRAYDGKPLPEKFFATAVTSSSNCTYCSTIEIHTPQFTQKVRPGTTWLNLETDGYAPAILGPINGKTGETIADIEIVLEKGFPVKIQVNDDQGQPIAGADLLLQLVVTNASIGLKSYRTDEQGIVLIPNATEHKYRIYTRKAGFQPYDSSNISIKPDEPVTITLKNAPSTTGTVISAEGKPIEGAKIIEFAKQKPSGGGHINGKRGAQLATTDAEGRFTLEELEEGANYFLLIDSKEYGPYLLKNVTAGQKDIRVKYGPELTVSGTIIGELDKLKKKEGKPIIEYAQTVSPGEHYASDFGYDPAEVEIKDSKGHFSLRKLLPGWVSITAGDHLVETKVDADDPQKQVVIDLTQPVAKLTKRQVIIGFATPDGTVPPQGTINVTAQISDSGKIPTYQQKTLAIENGVAKCDAYTSSEIYYNSKGLIGYWFKEGSTKVKDIPGPLEIIIPVIPAGAIAGQFLKADGTPAAENVSIGCNGQIEIDELPVDAELGPNNQLPQPIKRTYNGSFGDNIQTDNKGRFFITPLPFGGKFAVYALQGHNIQVSEPITLDETQATVDVTLKLSRTVSVEGVLLDPAGKPLAYFPYQLNFEKPKSTHGHGWTGYTTDTQGRFSFDDISADVGEYSIAFNPRKDYRPLDVKLPRDGKPITVQLKAGNIIEGQVVDDDTGRPYADAELYAMPSELLAGTARFGGVVLGDYHYYEAESRTDREGRFRFSNLGDGSYKIGCRNAEIQPPFEEYPTVKTGDKSVIIRVKPYNQAKPYGPEGGQTTEITPKESQQWSLRDVQQSSFADAHRMWRQEKESLAKQPLLTVEGPIDPKTGKFTPSTIAALQCRLGQEAHLNESFLLKELAEDADVHLILESSQRLCEKYGIESMAQIVLVPGQGYVYKKINYLSPQVRQELWLKAMKKGLSQDGQTNSSQPAHSD